MTGTLRNIKKDRFDRNRNAAAQHLCCTCWQILIHPSTERGDRTGNPRTIGKARLNKREDGLFFFTTEFFD